MSQQTLTASLTFEDGGYVAQCLEVDVASQGASKSEALENLREALELHFEEPTATIRPDLMKLQVETAA